MIKVYGIKNCDTVKKARAWLESKKIDYHFHDYRVDGVTENQFKQWNKRSTTWKELDDKTKETLNEKNAVKVFLEHPTLIKRPLLDNGKVRYVGFKEDDYKNIFN
jgi:arsenate reductase